MCLSPGISPELSAVPVPAARTELLAYMIRVFTASAASNMRLLLFLTKRRCALTHLFSSE